MSETELSRLIHMANHIAANNDFQSNTTESAATTASHIRKFWARSMKQQIIDYVAQDGSELCPAARLAVQQLDAPTQKA